MPRGRPNPLGQVANRGRVHSVASLEVLQQDRTELDEAQGRLAPGDDGVHAGAVAVVGTDAAIAVTVESRGVTARPAVPLTGDEIDERRFLGLLQLVPLSVLGAGWGRGARGWLETLTDPGPALDWAEYRSSNLDGQEGEPEVSPSGPIIPFARAVPAVAQGVSPVTK